MFGFPSLQAPNSVLSRAADGIHELGRSHEVSFPVASHLRDRIRRGPAAHPALQMVKSYVFIGLFGLLTFALLLTTAGFVASIGTERQIAAFAADSHVVMGIITGKHVGTGADSTTPSTAGNAADADHTYWLDVSFQAGAGEYHAGTGSVPETLYDTSGVGKPVRVTYLGSDPDQFYLADRAPPVVAAPIYATVFRSGVIVILLVLIAIATMVFWEGLEARPSGRH